MIKNIAAAAALAFSTAFLTCAPAQAAAPQSNSYPLPPYGYVLLAPSPLWPAPLLLQPAHPAAWFAYQPAVVHHVHR
ncbi:hypothetical protein OG625_18425 [Streptomyces sp. NBC_01351]|uniref:hypothetical protein n=1 Tax=Streptomyces sp. NBC_01351 TaxID=2903833 RepID=UPI002E36F6D5|nr:hypothetical protein [Streptomyces sp. NBC_01351]